MVFRRVAAATWCTLSVSGLACGKKSDDVGLAPAATALAESSAGAASSWRYQIDAKSATQVDMPGVKEHITGSTTAAAGTIDIVPGDLAQSRGLVRVDLASFATHTFGDDNKDSTQTKHARTWLESGVDGKTNDEMRWAEFAIRSIDNLSAADVKAVSPVNEGAERVRTLTMTVHGDLLVHGHKLPKEDLVAVVMHYPTGAAPDSKPTRIDVTSKQPMRVVLKEFDVSPRDPAGQILAWTASLVSKVAETADVTVAITATPIP